jgi:hypothetical protein
MVLDFEVLTAMKTKILSHWLVKHTVFIFGVEVSFMKFHTSPHGVTTARNNIGTV